ncbi:DNA-binding transcriptional ArsR family regulator [Kitasatospora sp. MAA4]|uniref:ArsR/SmtB family transcription factor n=1 Tax=Kitasatospora sp. MAA4 TaxID=3035093 RepID=UPI00247589FE|nr:metalloregulator ArsR/SmtB family transcription factor [Kitasatospora sp. MAA4]MDH6131366.1 DNA-binding transcriptional ArsR family regulator [Kitasatospora sp. MAA4]
MRDVFHADLANVSLTEVMHGLSDPLRLRIVDLLARRGETECFAIYSALGISKSNASHHFRVLRECGLLRRLHQGQQQSARLRTDEFEERFPGLLTAVLSNVDDALRADSAESSPVGA